MKKIWKDRKGFGGITAVLAIVLIVVIVGVAYMALAQNGDSDGRDQPYYDPTDGFIGYVHVNVQIKIEVPPYSGAEFTINNIEGELVEGEATQSMLEALFLSPDTGEKNLKLVVKMSYPAYGHTGLIDKSDEWKQEFDQPWMCNDIAPQYADRDYNSGAVRYHGSYTVEVTLYKLQDDKWVFCDSDTQTVVI